MKPIKYMSALALFAVSMLMAGCGYTTVQAGEVGIKVHLYGDKKGVQAEQVGTGRYFYNPFNTSFYTFPTSTQTRSWTQQNGEAISFGSMESMQSTVELGITYHVDPDKAAVLFQKYRKGINEITDVYIHNNVRDEFNKIAGTMPIEQIIGPGKAQLELAVQNAISADVGKDGLIIERIYMLSNPVPPDNVKTAINNKIQATQMAEQRQNEVKQAEAEAQKEVARANGAASANLIEATAKAKAIQLEGDALRANPALVQMRAVEKWNGVTPTIMSGGSGGMGFLMQLPGEK